MPSLANNQNINIDSNAYILVGWGNKKWKLKT
jgi:hypothetical protein